MVMYEGKSDHDLLITISQEVTDMHHRLFGNGSKGEIEKLQDRTSELEQSKSMMVGMLTIISTGLTLVGGTLVSHLLNFLGFGSHK